MNNYAVNELLKVHRPSELFRVKTGFEKQDALRPDILSDLVSTYWINEFL